MDQTIKRSFLAILFLLSVLQTTTASVGLTPGKMAVESVLEGGYAQQAITVFNTDDVARNFRVQIAGDASSWIAVSPDASFILGPKQSRVLSLVFTPPSGTAGKTFTNTIVVSASPNKPLAITSGASMALATVLDGEVSVSVTNNRQAGLQVDALKTYYVEVGMPIPVSLDFSNTGNTPASPVVSLKLYDSQGNLVESAEKTGFSLQATQSQTFAPQIPTDTLSPGDYTLSVEVTNEGRPVYVRSLKQRVLEVGGLNTQGIIVQAKAPSWVTAGDPVRLETTFRNLGSLAASTKIVADLSLEGKDQGKVESEEKTVLPGTQQAFTAFFTPSGSGQYVASVTALVAGKQTDPVDLIVNVTPPAGQSQTSRLLYYAVVAVAVLAILAFAFRSSMPEIRLKK